MIPVLLVLALQGGPAVELVRGFDGGWADVPALQAELVAVGPTAVPTLFDLLATGVVPGDAELELPDAPLSAPCSLAVTTALEGLPIDAVRARLDAVVAAGTPRERLLAIELLERFGEGDDLPRLAALTLREEEPPEPARLAAYTSAATRVLHDEPRAADPLCAGLDRLPAPLVLPTVDAVAEASGVRAFAALTRGLGRGHDPEVLLGLTRCLDGARALPDDLAAAAVRGVLAARDPVEAALVAELVALTDDVAAVPDLIETLEFVDAGPRRSLRAALRGLVRADLGDGSRGWWAWFEAEQAWLRAEGRRLTDELTTGDPETARRAAQALSAHRALRGELVPIALLGLEHADASVRAATCTALGELGSSAAAVALARRLESDDAPVREAARRALVRITGAELPLEAERWRAHLQHMGIDLRTMR